MTEIQRQSKQARDALAQAVAVVLDKKRRLGQYAVIFQNGRPVRVSPEQLADKKIR